MATVTCHTTGCDNTDIPILDVEHPDDATGQPVDPWYVVCGVCSQPITDITE